jgi:plastocyanin
MKMNRTLAAAAGIAAALQIATAGNITGTVTLKGTPPAEVPNEQLKSDATCGKLHAETPTTHHWVVGSKGELANVVVMLKGMDGKSTGASAPSVEVDQKGCEYTPQILAVQTGQKIDVKNSDPVMHNVHTVPTVAGNEEQNKAQMQGSSDLVFSMPKAENFLKFKCDVHPWMFAWVTVVDHPYFAVTGKDGTFTIKDVPPGKYKIAALHRKAAPTGVEKDIEVTADGAKTDFTLEVK